MAVMRRITAGDCMRLSFPGSELGHVTVTDDAAPIVSGDLVEVLFRDLRGRSGRIVKLLEHWPDGAPYGALPGPGRWYLRCDDGIAWMDPRSFVPDRIVKVTALEPLPPGSEDHVECARREARALAADDESRRVHALLTADARAYWAEHGYPRGVPFPGLDAVVGQRSPSHRVA